MLNLNLQAAMQDPEFLRIGDLVSKQIDNWFNNGGPDRGPFVVCFICKTGIHRSVTAARLWTEILRRSGFCVLGPNHLCKWNWWGCNGDCKSCDAEADGKKEKFDDFVTELDTP